MRSSKTGWLAVFLPVLVAGCGGDAASDTTGDDISHGPHTGNIYIADQYNNRVVEVDAHHRVVWQFGDGSSTAGPHSVVGPNDAERVGPYTLIAGTGVPAGAEPACPTGCADNRVLLVDHGGRIVWQYGQAGVTGAGADQLNAPVCAVYLPGFHFLITDQGNSRVIEVDLHKNIVWQYGQTGTAGAAADQLNNPNSAELLANGHVLIADEGNNRVFETTRDHHVVWSYGSPTTMELNAPAFASRLDNGHTLISDSGNNRAVEVDVHGHVVWQYVTNTEPGSNPTPNPTRAVRLRNGDTLISDQNNHRVIEVNHAGHVVFTQGALNVPGNGPDQLNGPYDAKAVGDYTGLTPPFGD